MSDSDSSEARDYVMARLAATRVWLSDAIELVDACVGDFLSPEQDSDGSARAGRLEAIDESIGEAARSVQLGQEAIADIDPEEGEPYLPEEDGHDEDDRDTREDAGHD